MQALRCVCATLRNKNNPTLQFLQEFFGVKTIFLCFIQADVRLFVEIVEGMQAQCCTVYAIPCANIDIACKQLYNRTTISGRNRQWQLPSRMSQRQRGSRPPRCPAPARTALPSAGRPRSGCAASWHSWATSRILKPSRWRLFPRPSASFCPPPSGMSTKTPFIWRSSAASDSSATSGGM